jgi:hypothetical protein
VRGEVGGAGGWQGEGAAAGARFGVCGRSGSRPFLPGGDANVHASAFARTHTAQSATAERNKGRPPHLEQQLLPVQLHAVEQPYRAQHALRVLKLAEAKALGGAAQRVQRRLPGHHLVRTAV